MAIITDDQMLALLPTTRAYSVVILMTGPNRHMAGVDRIIWEHGRRNFSLRADGLLPIVCPVGDGTEVTGVGIFNLGPEETARSWMTTPVSGRASSSTRCIPAAASRATRYPRDREISPPG